MNNNDFPKTAARLQALGLLDESFSIHDSADSDGNHMDNSDHDTDHSPWYIQVFLGGSGVLAGIFFVGFLTILLFEANIFDNTALQLAIGVILSVVGWVLFNHHALHRSPFWQSVAFAISAAGQLYVTFAIFGSDFKTPIDTWLLLLFQIVMTIIMPNFVYRLLSSTIALGCGAFLLGINQMPELIIGMLALIMTVANLQRYAIVQRVPPRYRPSALDITHTLTYASAFWLIVFSVYLTIAEYNHDFVSNDFIYHYALAQTLLVLACLAAAYLILRRYSISLRSKPSTIVMGSIVLLGALSVYAAGLLAIGLIIISAFANSQRVLLGIGIFALVSYVFWYYYQLDTSLLIKSGSMLTIAIAILLLRWALLKYEAKSKMIHKGMRR